MPPALAGAAGWGTGFSNGVYRKDIKMNNWIRKDAQYIWHPYTQMKDCEDLPPILIEKARGVKLYDNKGNFYYDTISSWWCNVHGHNHAFIKQAVKRQLNSLDHVLFAGFTHRPAIRLAEGLISVAPKNLSKVFFADNGSTAVETALKMSLQYWHNIGKRHKTKFISLDYAYHGDTAGAMGVGGESLFNEIFKPLFSASLKASTPYCYRCPMGKERGSCGIECAASLGKILKKNGDNVAAVILEPLVLGAAGMIVYPVEYLKMAARLAKKHNVHLILDEVATGFGRTGKMFAFEHAGIQPDFICVSKGITSGVLPLGAVLTSDEIYNAFYDDYAKKKTFYHGHTYTANPIACSAAIASLELFKKERTLERVSRLASVLCDGLERFRELEFAGDIRSIGMIGAIELVKDKAKKKPFNFKERAGLKVYKQGLKRGIVLRPLGSVIYLCPPLCIRDKEIKIILERMFEIIQSLS